MTSELAKVLHDVNGRPLLDWVLDALAAVGPDRTVVVVGYQAEDVEAVLPPGVETARQSVQLGTGHAAEIGLEMLSCRGGDAVLVLPGDMPLLQPETIDTLVKTHLAAGFKATVLTAVVDDPTGYGRIVRGPQGVESIVEQRDAGEVQLTIDEVNTGVYVFDCDALTAALARVVADNSQAERYLTDVIGIMRRDGLAVGALVASAGEGMGVNDDDQLAAAAATLRQRWQA